MKKIIIGLFMIIVFVSLKNGNHEIILIPSEAIRFRIIANSNEKKDQDTKVAIKDKMDIFLDQLLTKADSLDDARNKIKTSFPELKQILNSFNVEYDINFGQNFFPEKEFKGVTYKEGQYESLVVTLGAGAGENWWCVMFPPLCMLDTKKDELEDVQYQFFFKNIMDQYL